MKRKRIIKGKKYKVNTEENQLKKKIEVNAKNEEEKGQ